MKKLVSTLGLSHEEWLKHRKLGIGGSEAGAICGFNPYTSAMAVYLDKTSDEIKEIDNEAMRQGRDLEEYVARRFCEATGKKVRRANAIYCSEEHPFMFANVDRMVVGEDAGLECKTASAYNAEQWKDGEVPMHYQIQCHHYMAVTGANAWYIAVVILGRDFKYVKIDRDEELIRNLIHIEAHFWKEHVMKQSMPSPDGSDAAESLISNYYKFAKEQAKIELQGYHEKLRRRLELNDLIERMEKEKKQIEQEIKLAMADAEIAVCDDFYVTWKNMCTKRLDTDRLKEEQPEIYRQFIKEIQTRRFMIKVA